MQNFDDIPSPMLVTDMQGTIKFANQNLCNLSGKNSDALVSQPMEVLFPNASKIFLQTHVWPMLLREGFVREIKLYLLNRAETRTPVYVNCQRTADHTAESFLWIFFVGLERSQFEEDLLEARQRAHTLLAKSVKSERFFRAVADSLPSMIAYWSEDLICQFANLQYIKWFNKQPLEILGMSIKQLLGEVVVDQNLPYILGALAGEMQEFEREISLADGTQGYSLVHYIPDRDATGIVKGFFSLITNISTLKYADSAIRLSASVFEATLEGIIVTDANATILSVNPAFTRLTGYTSEEAVGNNASMLNSSRHSAEFFQLMYLALKSNKIWKGEIWNKRKDQSIFLERLAISVITDDFGNVSKYVGVFDDITQQRDREQIVEHMAFHDALTGLPNRLLLMERLGQLLAMSAREPRQIALLFLDLDGFKAVNDLLGHEMGDHVLKVVAVRLADQLRLSDTVARLGGDEFVILLDQPDSRESIAVIASRLIEAVNEPIQQLNRSSQATMDKSLEGVCIPSHRIAPASLTGLKAGVSTLSQIFDDEEKIAKVGGSIGIVVLQHLGQSAEHLLKLADAAMYKAKRSGKNIFIFSDENDD